MNKVKKLNSIYRWAAPSFVRAREFPKRKRVKNKIEKRIYCIFSSLNSYSFPPFIWRLCRNSYLSLRATGGSVPARRSAYFRYLSHTDVMARRRGNLYVFNKLRDCFGRFLPTPAYRQAGAGRHSLAMTLRHSLLGGG